LADHEAALVYADPGVTLTSRTVVRLTAIVVDCRHHLTDWTHAGADYRADADAGTVVPFADPVATARAFARSTTR
jgi:hypothetical protein